jgi:ATP-binding cassette subfamily F protein uup
MVSFDGTVILISHDRAFLDAVVTQTWVFDGEDHITEYVGGYEDYLRQRPDPSVDADAASASTKTPAKAETKSEAAETQPAKARVKLSYKQQKQLEDLPKQIEALETEQQQLTDHLAQGDIYASDPEGAGKMAERLSAIESELLELLEAWDELESLSN